MPSGKSAEYCDDCGEDIPLRRRQALPSGRTCDACQSKRDATARSVDINAEAARIVS
ncbi:MAG TPA: TraR/DksA C4-type zinc finger protein [Pseudorhizobium sp.]|nr:TraR/DksA C4-type zinc finger protein [Pseudorhizobium sp.]